MLVYIVEKLLNKIFHEIMMCCIVNSIFFAFTVLSYPLTLDCSIGNEDLTLPEQCEMTCVKCSLDLNLTVQQWSEVLCYLGKAKLLEDLTLGLWCSSEVSRVVFLCSV